MQGAPLLLWGQSSPEGPRAWFLAACQVSSTDLAFCHSVPKAGSHTAPGGVPFVAGGTGRGRGPGPGFPLEVPAGPSQGREPRHGRPSSRPSSSPDVCLSAPHRAQTQSAATTHPGWGRPPPSRGRRPSRSLRSSAALWPSGPPRRHIPNKMGSTPAPHSLPAPRAAPNTARPAGRAEDSRGPL